MARLQQLDGDSGNWGYILNEYLSKFYNSDGVLRLGLADETRLALNLAAKINPVGNLTGTLMARGIAQ